MSSIDSFTAVINELINFFDSLLALEDRKLLAIKNNDVILLEDYIKEEQVYVLKLRGLDKKRETIQAELGFGKLSFKEIIASADSELHEKLLPLFEVLNKNMELFKNTNASSKLLIERNLYNIEKLLESNNAASPSTYNKSGEMNNKNTVKFTSRKI